MRRKPSRPSGRKDRARPGAPVLHASVAQMRALAHPLRLRVLELFAEQPRTTMQVALLLGQPPTRLYHHVNALERAGLLHLRETRPNRGTTEKWYEAAAQSFQQKPEPKTRRRERGRKRALSGLGLLVIEQARRELAAAIANPRGERALCGRLIAVGSQAHVARIKKRVGEFLAELRRDCPSERAGSDDGSGSSLERWSLTLVFAPAWPRSGAADAGVHVRE